MRLPIATLMLAAVIIPRMATAAVSVAVAMPVSTEMQVALFRNIWKLDRNFDSTRAFKVGVLYQNNYYDSITAKDDFIAALGRQALRVTVILIEGSTQQALSGGLHGAGLDVLYVTPLRAVDVSEIGRISRYERFRTITGVPEYVDAGVAVGIGIRRDRPLIIVNLEQSRAEGSVFSSQLLALARIVGDVQ